MKRIIGTAVAVTVALFVLAPAVATWAVGVLAVVAALAAIKTMRGAITPGVAVACLAAGVATLWLLLSYGAAPPPAKSAATTTTAPAVVVFVAPTDQVERQAGAAKRAEWAGQRLAAAAEERRIAENERRSLAALAAANAAQQQRRAAFVEEWNRAADDYDALWLAYQRAYEAAQRARTVANYGSIRQANFPGLSRAEAEAAAIDAEARSDALLLEFRRLERHIAHLRANPA